MGKRIEVGVLGATGDGRPAVHPAARAASVVRADLARGQRAIRGRALRGRGVVAARDADARRTSAAGRSRRARRAAARSSSSRRSTPRSPATRARLRRRRPHRRQQRAQLPDGSARAAAHSRGRTPTTSRCCDAQRRASGWQGAIVTNPNCSTVVLAMALAPLRPFGLRACLVTTMQAVSGAGYPGVPSLDILGNVIPFIARRGREDARRETQKILGTLVGRPRRRRTRWSSAPTPTACR